MSSDSNDENSTHPILLHVYYRNLNNEWVQQLYDNDPSWKLHPVLDRSEYSAYDYCESSFLFFPPNVMCIKIINIKLWNYSSLREAIIEMLPAAMQEDDVNHDPPFSRVLDRVAVLWDLPGGKRGRTVLYKETEEQCQEVLRLIADRGWRDTLEAHWAEVEL